MSDDAPIDPYEVLGVTAAHSAEGIKAAYRRLVKLHHPDAGGDRAVFEPIQLAYDTLSDPERRAKYDAEGVIDGAAAPPDPERLAALAIIRDLTYQVLSKVDPDKPIYDDLVAKMKEAEQRHIATISENLTKMRAGVVALRMLAKRFDVKGDSNVIAGFITTKADEVEHQIPQMEQALTKHELVIEILADHSFDFDPAPLPQAQCAMSANQFYGAGGASHPYGFGNGPLG